MQDFNKEMLRSSVQQNPEDRSWIERTFGFGKFQLFAVFTVIWAVSSANYSVFPIAYLEIIPEFKCTYKTNDGD